MTALVARKIVTSQCRDDLLVSYFSHARWVLNSLPQFNFCKSYNFTTGIWFEQIENEIQEVPKSKWLEQGSIFTDPVPQINNWIVASIRKNHSIFFFALDEAGKEFTAWCQESFSAICISKILTARFLREILVEKTFEYSDGRFLFSKGVMPFDKAESYCRRRNASEDKNCLWKSHDIIYITPVVQLGQNHLAPKRPLRAKLFRESLFPLKST